MDKNRIELKRIRKRLMNYQTIMVVMIGILIERILIIV